MKEMDLITRRGPEMALTRREPTWLPALRARMNARNRRTNCPPNCLRGNQLVKPE